MIKKVTEIFQAWKISYKPDDHQVNLAAARMSICDTCYFKKTTPFTYCGACGCALEKKIYSPRINACPEGKWSSVEREHLG